MTTPKDIISKLQECIHIAQHYDEHIKALTQQVAHLEPSHNTVKALLMKVNFASETTNEDNLRMFIDHHTDLVAENTILKKKITDRDKLMEQLRKVVVDNGSSSTD